MKEQAIGVFASLGAGFAASLDAVKQLGLHSGEPEARPLRKDQSGGSRKAFLLSTGLILFLIVCFPSSSSETPILTGSEDFDLFYHTVVVKDMNGQPIEGALVKAFSPDLGTTVPHFEKFGGTNELGCYTFSLTRGNWVIISSSGWSFGNSHPGEGIFMSECIRLSANSSIVLRPMSTMGFDFRDGEGDPLEVDEIFCFSQEHIPAIAPAFVGRSHLGEFTLHTAVPEVAVLCRKASSATGDGYLLTRENIAPGDQLQFRIKDSFDNDVEMFSGPDGRANINLELTSAGQVLYDDSVGKYTTLLFYGTDETYLDDTQYELDIDFGPLGNLGTRHYSGLLYEPTNLFEFKSEASEHSVLALPKREEFREANLAFVDMLEEVYAPIGDFTGEQLYREPHTAELNFVWCGQGGTSFVGYGLGISRWPMHVHAARCSILSHELGHLCALTPPLVYGNLGGWFDEPLAAYLGIEGVTRVFGSKENIRLWYWGTHPGLFDYLLGDNTVGEIERMQFLFFYLHWKYGAEIHSQFARAWSAGERQCISSMTEQNQVAAVYSYLAGENLASVFGMLGIDVEEDQADLGMRLLTFISGNGKAAEPYVFVKKWPELPTGWDLHCPYGVAVDSSRNVYVADTNNHRIKKFTSDGEFIETWGRAGNGDGEFNYPHGVGVDSSGSAYVADTPAA